MVSKSIREQIDANGFKVTISGDNRYRVFHVNPGITLTLTGLHITTGAAGDESGGAVYVESGGTLNVINSTFTNNTSLSGNGGGIFMTSATATITNSTFSGNITYGTGQSGLGGAIYAFGSTVTITNSTFSGNGAQTNGGGGIFVRTNSAPSVTNIRNSIFTSNQGGNCATSAASITNQGGNIGYGDTTCVGFTNANPLLSSLGEYGSTTPLFELQTGSPAINLATANCPVTDQRGVTRSTPTCDSGSYEYRTPTSMTIATSANTSTYGQLVTFTATVSPSAATGVVRFFTNGVLIGNGTVNVGSASVSTSVLQTSSYTVTATYLGDLVYERSSGLLSGTQRVNKVALTITAENKSKVFGTTNPNLTFSATGFVNNENASVFTPQPTCTTTAVTDSPVSGSPYLITCSGGAADNYTFDAYQAGGLTVSKAELTVAADNLTKKYLEPNPALTYTVSGFVNDEEASVLSGSPVLTTTATADCNGGVYPIFIRVGTLSAANYTFRLVDSALTVVEYQIFLPVVNR